MLRRKTMCDPGTSLRLKLLQLMIKTTRNHKCIDEHNRIGVYANKHLFCYAHEDEALLNKLKSHLRPIRAFQF